MNVTSAPVQMPIGSRSMPTVAPFTQDPPTQSLTQSIGGADTTQLMGEEVEGTDVAGLLGALIQNFAQALAQVGNAPCCCPAKGTDSATATPTAGPPGGTSQRPQPAPPSSPAPPGPVPPPEAKPGGATPSNAQPAGANPVPPPAPVAATSNLQETQAWIPIDAPRTNAPGQRSADEYGAVIDQFDVENNPRYTPRVQNPGGPLDTFCNIFVSDVTKAMGADIPHYWQGQELDANRTADWLRDSGPSFGWRQVTEQEAQDLANQGKPVVVTWSNPNGIGHSGVVRPGENRVNSPIRSSARAF